MGGRADLELQVRVGVSDLKPKGFARGVDGGSEGDAASMCHYARKSRAATMPVLMALGV